MDPSDLRHLTALDIRDAVRARRVSAREVCRASLEAIAADEPRLHAFITLSADRALESASLLDRDPARAASLPLAGVPVAVKDNLCTAGLRTTAGSRMLEAFVPPYDATAVRRLQEAGAIVVGKTNCDEFAMGSSTEYSAFGATKNPCDPSRTPGGSSGGSAAAVASLSVPLALGSDTGGSVRQPASFCGVLGLKPTYGRVSRYGLIAFASSLDQVGVFSRTAADAALALATIAGADPLDATCASQPVPDLAAALDGRVDGLRVGVPATLLDDGVDAAVRAAFERGLERMRALGMLTREIELPHSRYAIPVYHLVANAEASANLARYDGVRYGYRAAGAETLADMYETTRGDGFGPEVKRRIMLGTYALSAGYYEAYYRKAQQVRTLIRQDFEAAFRDVDLVALPTAPTPAFPLGERIGDPLRMYLADLFTAGPSLAGLPALSLPCGATAEGLPIGLQVVGPMFGERGLLRVAGAMEDGK